jgi:signal transduction histidine kinase
VALALLIALLSLISFTERASLLLETADGPLHFASPDFLGAVQVLVGCLALAWRRTAPGVVLLVCVASTIGRYAEHYPVMPLPYAVLAGVYTVAQRWPLRRSAIAVAVVAAVMAVSAMILLSPSLDDEPMIDAVAVLTAGAFGRGVRMRQVRTALLEERARLLEEQSRRLAQEQATMAELAAARERESIARELHDIVANNVSVIAAQAASTRRAADSAAAVEGAALQGGAVPEAPRDAGARATLATIESLARETLGDMRRLVGVLQSADHGGISRNPARLDALPALVAKVQAAGTDVTLSVTGARRELPAAVELNAYRIVQESLTNAMKHASGSRVEVHIDYQPALLHLVVRDFGGHGTTGEPPGSGLTGMRQRVALLGGSLSATPEPQGGFVVAAQVPLDSSATALGPAGTGSAATSAAAGAPTTGNSASPGGAG